MPSMHRYKCLNPSCPGPGNRNYIDLFRTMNSPQPTCPGCGSIKLADWGEWPGSAGWIRQSSGGGSLSDGTRQLDRDMRSLADNLGMTNLSNKDGRAMKGNSPTDAKGEMGHIKLPGGVMAPVDFSPKCSNIGLTSTPLKLQTGAAFAGKPSPGQSIPTRVVASHKGAA